MVKKFVVFSICLLNAVSAFGVHPRDTDNDRGGPANLACTFGRVERAGVALVKDYGPSTQNPALRFSVIVGADRNRTHHGLDYVNFFGGNCESNDKYSTVTAVEELYEETGKAIDIPSSSLLRGKDRNYYGYVYSGDNAPIGQNTPGKNYNQLFFYRMDQASVSVIGNAMQQACNNPNLSHRFKENKGAYAIPLKEIFDRAIEIYKLEAAGQSQQARDDNYYIFESRGVGDGTGRTRVFLDPQYMRNIARDLARDPTNLPRIYSEISGGFLK